MYLKSKIQNHFVDACTGSPVYLASWRRQGQIQCCTMFVWLFKKQIQIFLLSICIFILTQISNKFSYQLASCINLLQIAFLLSQIPIRFVHVSRDLSLITTVFCPCHRNRGSRHKDSREKKTGKLNKLVLRRDSGRQEKEW